MSARDEMWDVIQRDRDDGRVGADVDDCPVARPEAFYLTTIRGSGRKVDLIDREAAGRVMRGYMRQGLWPFPLGGHEYSIAVPAGRWHCAYLIELRPA